MSSDNEKKEPLLRSSAKWVIATIFGALLGLAVKHFWEAPRPVVELISVDVSSKQEDTSVFVDLATVSEISEHPYYPDIESSISAASLIQAIDGAKQADRKQERIITKLDVLIDLLRTRAGEVAIRRKEFLIEWGKGDNETLEKIVQSVLVARESQLPKKYKSHPEGSENLFISLAPGLTVDLSELDEEALAQGESEVSGPVNVYQRVKRAARETNLLRRFLIYLEPSIGISLLEDSKKLVQSWLSRSESLSAILTGVLSEQSPERIFAEVLITNRGTRPLPLRGIATIHIRLPKRGEENQASEVVPVRMKVEAAEHAAFVIDGGNAQIVSFVSLEAVGTIVENHSSFQAVADGESSRFIQLYRGEGLSASAHLLEAGKKLNDASLPPSSFTPIGEKAGLSAYQALEKI